MILKEIEAAAVRAKDRGDRGIMLPTQNVLIMVLAIRQAAAHLNGHEQALPDLKATLKDLGLYTI